ncbi:MAG: iron-containing redox enzyme family protein [Bdellovibrionales bacterium]|nr:iron-containing redox enzyme family protein [Bdellovibrionales bacterium]
MNHLTDFKKYSNSCLETLCKEVETFPWDNAFAYAHWLAQTYYYVSHSTRLLALGASRFPVAEDVFHQRFLAHAGEEKKHEFLALADLKTMGMEIDTLPEFSATRSFYQVQYYWIEHVSPKAFYGYIVMLEGLAVAKARWIENAVKPHFQQNVTRFLTVHANEDPGHLENAYAFISKLTANDKQRILLNFDQSLQLYSALLRQCEQAAQTTALRKSA